MAIQTSPRHSVTSRRRIKLKWPDAIIRSSRTMADRYSLSGCSRQRLIAKSTFFLYLWTAPTTAPFTLYVLCVRAYLALLHGVGWQKKWSKLTQFRSLWIHRICCEGPRTKRVRWAVLCAAYARIRLPTAEAVVAVGCRCWSRPVARGVWICSFLGCTIAKYSDGSMGPARISGSSRAQKYLVFRNVQVLSTFPKKDRICIVTKKFSHHCDFFGRIDGPYWHSMS